RLRVAEGQEFVGATPSPSERVPSAVFPVRLSFPSQLSADLLRQWPPYRRARRFLALRLVQREPQEYPRARSPDQAHYGGLALLVLLTAKEAASAADRGLESPHPS